VAVSNQTKDSDPDKGLEKEKFEIPPPSTEEESGAMALPKESQLISFGDRMTYTFSHGKEVGSIHFDRGRGEIFYKGHNIRNMDLEEWQMQVMEQLRRILDADEQGKQFADSYGHTLDKIILEKKNAFRKI
jgi:hypothetical protein